MSDDDYALLPEGYEFEVTDLPPDESGHGWVVIRLVRRADTADGGAEPWPELDSGEA